MKIFYIECFFRLSQYFLFPLEIKWTMAHLPNRPLSRLKRTWNQHRSPVKLLFTKFLKRSGAAAVNTSLCPHTDYIFAHINSQPVKYIRKSRYLVKLSSTAVISVEILGPEVYILSLIWCYIWGNARFKMITHKQGLVKSTEALFSAPQTNGFRLLHWSSQTPTHMHIM